MARIYYESRIRPPFFNTTDSTVGYDTMNRSINDAFVIRDGKEVAHRTLLKIILNPILRSVQFWSNKPYVIASEYDYCPVNGFYFIHYRFMKVEQKTT